MKLILSLIAASGMLMLTACTSTEKSNSPFQIGAEYSITGNGAFWRLDFDGEIEKREGLLEVRILELRPPAWARVELLKEEKPPFWLNLEDTRRIKRL
jgi:hypothetical protein